MELDYRRYPILVVDDEPDILRALTLTYQDEFSIVTADSGAQGLVAVQQHAPGVIIADQRMPEMTGTEFLERSMAIAPHAVRIILTGYTDIEALIRAVNNSGIYRYITKPWNTGELRITLRRALEAYHLEGEYRRLLEELRQANERLRLENEYFRKTAAVTAQQIIGQSPAIHRVLDLIAKVAATDSTVLLEGETGTGKELVARCIHAASRRSQGLFVAVNCAELSEGILESELFGHRKGAFTGAVADRKGLFELSDGGTLFLDEIAETTLGFQAKFLRVLQEGEIRSVGADQPRRVDVRIIAATNRKLDREVKDGRFRDDLYYRLRVFPIHIAPLRERPEDIAPIAVELARRLSARLKKPVGELTPEALAMLARCPFPGNVRQLANELERAILMAEPGAPLSEDLFAEDLLLDAVEETGNGLQKRVSSFEREQIEAALARAGGVKVRAAAELGLTYRGLIKKMHRLGL